MAHQIITARRMLSQDVVSVRPYVCHTSLWCQNAIVKIKS